MFFCYQSSLSTVHLLLSCSAAARHFQFDASGQWLITANQESLLCLHHLFYCASQNTLFNQHVYHVISPRSLFTKWSDSPHGYIFLFSLSLPRMAGWILKTQKKNLELTSLPHESFQILPGFRSHFGVPLQFGHGQVGVHRQRVPQSPSYRSQFFLGSMMVDSSTHWKLFLNHETTKRISSRISRLENETRLEAIWKWNNHGIFMNSVLDLLMLQFKILRAVFFSKKKGARLPEVMNESETPKLLNMKHIPQIGTGCKYKYIYIVYIYIYYRERDMDLYRYIN